MTTAPTTAPEITTGPSGGEEPIDVPQRVVDLTATEGATAGTALPSGPVAAATPARRPGPVALIGSSLSLLALAILAFVVNLTLVSSVEHARSQRVAYADFRAELSAVTAPTGQLDGDGRLLALGTPVAYLTSSDLGLEREVVFEGTTGAVLAKGPGHRRSSALPGQPGVAVLYGRAWAYGGPFGGAGDLVRGSTLSLTTGQGTHTYSVTGVRRAGDPVPTAPDVAAGEGRLTLVTADGEPFAPDGALYVDATLTSPAVPAAPRVLGASGLLSAEGPLATDRTAWPTVLLFLQGLALASLALTFAVRRWGAAQAWLVGVPVLSLLFVLGSREITRLLPNLL